jgi:hypothetical protein
MSARRELIGLLLAVGMAAGACAAAPSKPGPAMHCRHPLATVGSADGLPGPVAGQLRSWMALHGEAWNRTDAITPGELTAGFLWAGQWNGDWVIAYRVGGIACCSTRLALFTPSASGGASYRWVTPPTGAPDNFGDASCKGIDAVLDAYGTHR